MCESTFQVQRRTQQQKYRISRRAIVIEDLEKSYVVSGKNDGVEVNSAFVDVDPVE